MGRNNSCTGHAGQPSAWKQLCGEGLGEDMLTISQSYAHAGTAYQAESCRQSMANRWKERILPFCSAVVEHVKSALSSSGFPSTIETWTKWRQPNKRPWRLWGLKILIQEDRLRELEPFIPKKNVQRDLIHTYKALVRVASTNLNTGNSIVHKKKLFSFGVQRNVMESPSLLIHRTQMDVAQSNLL